ncbi:hypothetical protein [Roseivirga pacifica]
MKKRISTLFIQLFLAFVLLEIGILILSKTELIKLEEPIYTFENSRRYWAEIDEDFGVWRHPNYKFRHKKTCFDVRYETNSIGARDKERSVVSNGNKRVVLLGDSFAEGWGVNVEDRFSNLLEEETGSDFLNFAVSGAGMTQQYLIYRNKAMEYDHDAVLWAIFPINDLIDDDIDYHKKYSYDRYRAYWVGDYPNYHLEHGLDSIQQSHYYLESPDRLKVLLKNFTYTYNLLRWFKNRQRKYSKPEFQQKNEPDYFYFTEAQWDRIRYNIEKMKDLLGDKKLYVFTLPGEHTIKAYQNGNNSVPLRDSLKVLSSELDFEYLDLLENTDTKVGFDWSSYYYNEDCDVHWNELGHKWAATSIKEGFSLE